MQLARFVPVPLHTDFIIQQDTSSVSALLSSQVRVRFDHFWIVLRNIFFKAEQGLEGQHIALQWSGV